MTGMNLSAYACPSNSILWVMVLAVTLSGCWGLGQPLPDNLEQSVPLHEPQRCTVQDTAGVVGLPTAFHGYHHYLRPITLQGDTLNFITDTGGNTWIRPEVANRHSLPTVSTGHVIGEDSLYSTSFPTFERIASIPPTVGATGQLQPWTAEGRILVQPLHFLPHTLVSAFGMETWSGMLGFDYFAGRTWTFDYETERLWLRPTGSLPSHAPHEHLKAKAPEDSTKKRVVNLFLIDLAIESDTLAFFFDTGAGTTLNDSAMAVLRDGLPRFRGVSFVRSSVFETWRTRYPSWRVIENASLAVLGPVSMIQVPRVSVAGETVGPSWFVEQPDPAMDKLSAAFGRRVDGALGASVLRHFAHVTVDYLSGQMIFQRRRCR